MELRGSILNTYNLCSCLGGYKLGMLGWVTKLNKPSSIIRLNRLNWINMLSRLGWVTKLQKVHSYLHFGPTYIYLVPTYHCNFM
jgi:hypothetical protein